MFNQHSKPIRFIRVDHLRESSVTDQELIRRGYKKYMDTIEPEKDRVLAVLDEIMKAIASGRIK